MSQVWSEYNHIVNVLNPAEHGASSGPTTDIVDMENYKKCTFIVQTGASAANIPVITVLSGVSNASAATATAFNYRTQIKASDATSSSGDVPGDLTSVGTSGFAMTTSKAGGCYIIEVDAPTVCAATTGTTYYDHVCLDFSTGATAATHFYGVLAVLSEPRYPQAVLDTAIE